MKCLITGFEPFGNEEVNPSWEAVQLLPEKIKNLEIKKLQIPVVFQKSWEVLEKAIADYEPDYILLCGQAGGKEGIHVERVAINLDDARIPDNQNQQPVDQMIQPLGPNAYFSNLPVREMVDALKQSSIAASISYSAGTYVCNHLLYQTLHFIHQNQAAIKTCFIHVPYCTAQIRGKQESTPYMEMEDIVKALTILLETIC